MTNPIERLTVALADKYRIDRELGAGGMATVYLAHDIKHDRDVAIKVLKPELGAVLGAERFLSEIKVTANLQHPHLLPLFDSGEADGLLFYVMPFIEGETLCTLLQREHQLPIDETIRLVTLIAGALDFAHARGVVHRDLKPENILLQAGQPIVADFGIALAVSNAGGERVTQTGLSLGTPHYMSPEQAAGDRTVNARSDQYALAALTYEMLTGDPPHTGATAQVLIARLMTETPRSIRTVRSAVSANVDAAVMRALSKSPADRFATCGDFARALAMPDAVVASNNSPRDTRSALTNSSASSRLRASTIGASVIVLAALAIAAWLLFKRAPTSAVITSSAQLTRAAGREEFPTIAPDGKSVAYLASDPADTAAHVEFRRTDGGDAVQIAGASQPTGWSPSGDRLLVSSPRGLEVRPALGGLGTIIDSRSTSACWSPDGRQIAYFVADSLFVGGLNRETPRFVTRMLQAHSPAWSPDGKWIAFVSGNTTYFTTYNIAPSRVWLVAASGGTPLPLTPEDGLNISPTWAPDSRRLLMVSALAGARDVYQLNLLSDGHPRGAPVRITTGLNPSLISLSADGGQLAYSVATYHTGFWKAEVPKGGAISTRGALPVSSDRQTVEALDISRDGKWLVFDSDREGVQQIFRMPLAGGPVQQLTNDSNPKFKPMVSPNGKEVVYHAIVHGQRRVFVVGIDGGKPTQISAGAAPDERNASWSPDGRHVAWIVPGTGYYAASQPVGLFRVQVSTRDEQGHWSAATNVAFNGRILTVGWADEGTALIGIDSSWHYVMQSIAGGPPRRVRSAITADSTMVPSGVPVNSSDGRLLYFVPRTASAGARRSSVLEYRLADGAWREVLRFDEPARPHSTASNGIAEYNGWLYFTLSDFQSDIWVAAVTGLKK